MTDFKILPPEVTATFVELAQKATFPMTEDEGIDFLDTIPGAEADPTRARLVRRFPETNNAFISRMNNDGQTTQIMCCLCDGLSDLTTEERAQLNIVFTDAAAVATQVLGAPTKRSRGKEPKITWQLANGGRIVLQQSDAVVLDLDSPWMIALDDVTM